MHCLLASPQPGSDPRARCARPRPRPQVIGALSPAERDLLSSKLAALARALEPGLVRLNWSSRGIDDFVSKAGAAVHEFQGLVNQVGRRRALLHDFI